MPTLTFVEAIRDAMKEEMERDDRVFILGEDVGRYGGAFRATEGLWEKFGSDRLIDTPISESATVGAALGASLMGLRPIVEFQFIDFIACAFNQIVNFVAKYRYRTGQGVPMVLRGPCGGGVHAGPFHSQSPEMWFVHTPGLKVVQPATVADAKGLLKSAIREDDPVLFLEHKFLYRRLKEEIPEGEALTPIGQAAVRKIGTDLTLVTYGAMLQIALETAKELESDRISVEVIDLRSLYPLDRETLCKSVEKTHRLLVLHEDTRTGGIAGEIAATICETSFHHLDAPILRVTAPDTPFPYAPVLEAEYLPKKEDLKKAARELVRY